MTDFIEPANSLLLNGYSKRIQGLIQSTKTKIQYGTTYALKNEQINNTIKKITEISHPFVEKYSQIFNGKFELVMNYVPNKLDVNVLEKFQATREKVFVLSDKFLTNAEEQINGLCKTMALPEEKPVECQENKAIKHRVQLLLKKSNLIWFTLMKRIYDELRSKNFNKDKLVQVFMQMKEKLQSIETVEDLQILSEMCFGYLMENLVNPSIEMLLKQAKFSKEFIVKLPANLKAFEYNALLEQFKEKFKGMKDVTVVFYRDRVHIMMNKEALLQAGTNAIGKMKKKADDLKSYNYKGLDLKKKVLELMTSGQQNSMELYNSTKKTLGDKRENIRKALNEKKIAKKLKEQALKSEEKAEEKKMKERQEKILEDIEKKRLEKLEEKEQAIVCAMEEEE